MATQLVRRPDGPQAWEDHRAMIVNLYTTRGLELEEVMNIMEKEHFFKATKKQYKSHFTAWGIRKNVKSIEWNAIFRKKREREQEGKESAFRLGGTPVDSLRIAREEKRRNLGDENRLAEAVTPPNLIYSTPSPIAYTPSADSPIFVPSLLFALLSNTALSSSERELCLLRRQALIFDGWSHTAISDYTIIFQSMLHVLVWMIDPLLYEERGDLIDIIQTTISVPNGCFLCWAKLVFETLEPPGAKDKSSKRDKGNSHYEFLAGFVINHLVEGPHGKIRGFGSPSVVSMLSFDLLLRLLHIHAISGAASEYDRSLRRTANPLQDLLNSVLDERVSFLSSPCCIPGGPAVEEGFDPEVKCFRTHTLPLRPILRHSIDILIAISTVDPQTGAHRDHQPEGSLSSRILSEALKGYISELSPLQQWITRDVRLNMQPEKQKRMDTLGKIGSPTPPSPGSVRSEVSFISDPVVDWKEHLHGLSPRDWTQGNTEAQTDE